MTESKLMPGMFDARPGGAIELQHPLAVFGRRFKVELSTAFTLAPSTVLRALLGDEAGSRSQDGAAVSTVKAIKASRSGVRRATDRTRNLVRQAATPLIRPEHLDLVVDSVLSGTLPQVAVPPRSLWEISDFQDDPELGPVCNQMALFDWACWDCQALSAAGKYADRDALAIDTLGAPPEAWREINPSMDWFSTLALDSALIALARFGGSFAIATNKATSDAHQVQTLLRPGRSPIGHWLWEVQCSARQSSLPELSRWLDRHGAVFESRLMTISDLKKWSAGQRRMPSGAMLAVLNPLSAAKDRAMLARRFYLAQLLLFLCDMARSSVKGAPPSLPDMQGQIIRRFEQICRGEGA